jgi:lipopolysaccharide export system protein LptC
MTATPPPELHLPDLPEVSVQLGGAPPPSQRPAQSWRYRVLQALSSYLPLLLMALLAGSTWWLIKHTPTTAPTSAEALARPDPDYTMTGFSISRFGPDGREVLRIAGDVLRHYPVTDRLEIEGARIHATAPDGRITDASARRALANGDGSEVQLIGGAQVTSQLQGADMLHIDGEFLHAFLRFEQLRSHLPVRVLRGGTEAHAGGMAYDNLLRQLQLSGPVRVTLAPPGSATAATP